MAVDPATDLIEQYINESVKPDEPVRFVFALTSDEWSESLGRIAGMARENKIAYEVITNKDDKNKRAHVEIANDAARQYNVVDALTQMETILVEAPQASMLVLWDDKREDELNDMIGKFVDAGVKVLDLTDNLRVLSRDIEDDEGAGPDIEPEGDEDEDEDESEPDEDEEDEAEPEAEGAEIVYTRAALEKMSHSDVKDIAVAKGLAPRKARENMIVAILEVQGGPEAVAEAPVRSQEAVEEKPVVLPAHAMLESFRGVLDEFGTRFFTGLDEFTTRFIGGLEGIQFNMTPEQPMEVEDEPAPTRRLRRG
jgi:hypothetical protein